MEFAFPAFFKEEILEEDNRIVYPSIEEFREEEVYSSELRYALKEYFSSSLNIISTSYRRYSPYFKTESYELAYFTDGEVIFNNFLFDYIIQNGFAIPSKWLEIIKSKSFAIEPISIDFDKLSNSETDIFMMMSEQTFESNSLVKQFLC